MYEPENALVHECVGASVPKRVCWSCLTHCTSRVYHVASRTSQPPELYGGGGNEPEGGKA